MILEGEAIPGERGNLLGVVLVEFQPGDDLRAHALERIGIEARLRQGEAQQVERLVPVGGQHLHIAEHHVAAGVEVDAHGKRLQALLEGDGVELAGALVHHAGDEISEALLVFRVLGGAAAEGKAHGDQGIGVALDQPSLDAAGARDALDVHGVSRRCGKRREERKCSGKPKALPGEWAQKPRLPHGV